MDYNVESKDGITVIALNEPHLDQALTATLKAELLILTSQDDGPLIIDLSNVSTCDADGLAALLMAQRMLNDAGRALKISGSNAEFKKLLRISQLAGMFELYATVRAGRASCGPKRKSTTATRVVKSPKA